MRIESFLISPLFYQRKVGRPANLLEQFEADETFIFPARIAVLLERRNPRRSRPGHHFNIRHREERGIRRQHSTVLRRDF